MSDREVISEGRRLKTSTKELEGAALDWAVAQCVGVDVSGTDRPMYSPSSNWLHCGELIDRYLMLVDVFEDGTEAKAVIPDGPEFGRHYTVIASPTRVAICQAVVGAHYGDTVDVPESLL